jgi:hypothetical protein
VLFGLYGIFGGIAGGNALTAVVALFMVRRLLNDAEQQVSERAPNPLPNAA